MKPSIPAATLLALALAACSSPSDSGTADASATQAGEAECRGVIDKSMELQNIPEGSFDQIADMAVAECLESGKLTVEQYECAVAASDIDQFQACGIDLST
jgi:hypothetical protein